MLWPSLKVMPLTVGFKADKDIVRKGRTPKYLGVML